MRGVIGRLLLVGLFGMVAGCGGGGPSDTTPPTISDVQVSPTQLRFTGGEVTVSAKVSDPSGVAEVWAEVQKPDGTKERVAMSLAGEVYRVAITVAANTRSDGQGQTYRVWVRGKDRRGNETPPPGEPTGGVAFTVPAPMKPPDIPSL